MHIFEKGISTLVPPLKNWCKAWINGQRGSKQPLKIAYNHYKAVYEYVNDKYGGLVSSMSNDYELKSPRLYTEVRKDAHVYILRKRVNKTIN
jgi:hypothetical protein